MNKPNYADFVRRVSLMQGDAIDLSNATYLGPNKPIVVRCTRDGLTFAVERASNLYNQEHPTECPLCRERRLHTQRMNRIRLQESVRLRSAMDYINIL